jgi:hypothetical protein
MEVALNESFKVLPITNHLTYSCNYALPLNPKPSLGKIPFESSICRFHELDSFNNQINDLFFIYSNFDLEKTDVDSMING